MTTKPTKAGSQPMLHHCSRCGQGSTIEAAFSKSLFGKKYCPTCITKRLQRSTLLNYLLLPVVGLVLYILPGYRWVGWIFLQVTAVLFLSVPLIVLHELAHVVTANLLGLKAFQVVIGMGRPLFSIRAFGIRWEIRSLPWGGATAVSGLPQTRFRTRLALVFLAGPLLHIFLVAVLSISWLLAAFFEGALWLRKFFELSLYSNLLILVSNLFPRQVPTVAGRTGTDTWQIFNLINQGQQERDRIHAGYYFLEAWTAYQAGDMVLAQEWLVKGQVDYPNDVALQNLKGVVAIHIGNYGEAYRIFTSLLEILDDLPPSQPEAQPGFRYLMLNNIAYAGLMQAEPAYNTQVDEYSEAAYQNMPWQPEIAGTRGAALVALGKPAEGLPLLRAAMAQSVQPVNKALNACHIALGEISLGNLSKAQKSLNRAKRWDSGCPLIPRVEAAITAHSGETMT